jgi:outer membrane murein-binding lipoprotein Lpp
MAATVSERRVASRTPSGAETVTVSKSFNYDDREETRNLPLRLEEVEALILNGGAAVAKEQRRMLHFLHRVAATLREHGMRMSKLQRDVESIREEKSAAGHPMARAVQAISELDEQQKRQLLDEGYLRELAKLEKARADAELIKAGAENEGNRIRMALASILEDKEVPSEVKQHLRNLLERIGYRY